MTKIGLLFGSFNPIHNGHLNIASNMLELTDIEQVWFVVSPHNPLKSKTLLLNNYQRLHLVELAVKDHPLYKVCDVEFNMPDPSYTFDTLELLSSQYPQYQFVLIIGSDSLINFHLWRKHEALISKYQRYVYPRPNTPKSFLENIANAKLVNAPMLDISSTQIRTAIENGMDYSSFLPKEVYLEIEQNHLYE